MTSIRIVVTQYGGPDVITVVEEECPRRYLGEVRVKVLAAGVSLPDVLAREGVHPETPRAPYTPWVSPHDRRRSYDDSSTGRVAGLKSRCLIGYAFHPECQWITNRLP